MVHSVTTIKLKICVPKQKFSVQNARIENSTPPIKWFANRSKVQNQRRWGAKRWTSDCPGKKARLNIIHWFNYTLQQSKRLECALCVFRVLFILDVTWFPISMGAQRDHLEEHCQSRTAISRDPKLSILYRIGVNNRLFVPLIRHVLSTLGCVL